MRLWLPLLLSYAAYACPLHNLTTACEKNASAPHEWPYEDCCRCLQRTQRERLVRRRRAELVGVRGAERVVRRRLRRLPRRGRVRRGAAAMLRRRGPRSDSDQADEAHRLGPQLRGRHPQMGRRDDGHLPRRHRVLAASYRRLYWAKRVHRVRLHAVAEVQWWCVPALADQHRRHCKRRGRLGHELHVAHGRRVQRRDARRETGRDHYPKARVFRRSGPGLPPDLHGVLATDLRIHVADLDDAHRIVRHGAGVLPRDALPLRLHGRLRELPNQDRAGGVPGRRRRLLQRRHARVPPDASAARAAGPDRALPPPGPRLGESAPPRRGPGRE